MSKRRKQRMKRAYLKPWSAAMVNTGRSINKHGIKELYGDSAQGIGIEEKYNEELNRFFGIDVGKYTFISEERQHCISNVQEIVTRFDHWKAILLWESRNSRVQMFFSGDKAFFVKEDLVQNRVHRSVEYVKDRAMYYYGLGRVRYVIHSQVEEG